MPSSSPSSTVAEAGDIPHNNHPRPLHPSYTADAPAPTDARFAGGRAMLQEQQRAQGLRPPGHKCVCEWVCMSVCVCWVDIVLFFSHFTYHMYSQAGADAGGGAVRVAGGGRAGQELGVLAAEVKMYICISICVCMCWGGGCCSSDEGIVVLFGGWWWWWCMGSMETGVGIWWS